MKKQVISGILFASLLAGALASCGEASTAGTQEQDTQPVIAETEAVTEEPDALELRKQVPDDLGEHDFGGYEFRVVTCDDKGDYVVMEEETGDVIDDAVFQRNIAVEDRFNCKIALVTDDGYTEVGTFMTKNITAGEDAFDLSSYHVVQLGAYVPSGYFLNWYDIPNINFSKPWWSVSTVNNLTIDGCCFTAIGDFAISAMTQSYCTFYNKKLGQDFDFPDIYQVVRDGKYTFDFIVELTKDIYQDLNTNSTIDDEDLFGYTSDSYSNMNTYLWAFDNPIFKNTENGVEFVYKTEKINDIVTKICSTFNQYDGIRSNKSHVAANNVTGHGYSRDMFAKGLSVFANGYISMSLTHFRDLKDDFSILPYPKWDEAQPQYYTMADGNHSALSVPKTANDLDTIGVITEALCAESYKILYPAYYDVALKVKSTRDEESVEMLDMIVNSRIFDFGYVFDAWKGCSFFLEQLVQNNNTNFESFYAKKEKAVTQYYTKVLDFFAEAAME